MLGEGDTPKLYARHVRLDTSHDTPYGGGNSVDGATVYIDAKLYEEIRSGKVSVRGMSSGQIVSAICEHEHTEWAVTAGDNPVDTYAGAHGFAAAKEDKFVDNLGVAAERYEEALKPALVRCLARDPVNVPTDLWCEPYLDNPTPRDHEILRIFRAKNVTDAFKGSKLEAQYGIGAQECRECRHWQGKSGAVRATCEKVSGPIRADRRCDWFEEK